MTHTLLNSKIVSDNKTLLDQFSDKLLQPVRYLFHGKDFTLYNGAVIRERESYPQKSWTKTAMALTALLPSLLFGSTTRLLALTSATIRNNYNTASDYLNGRNIVRMDAPAIEEINEIIQNEPYSLESSIAKITDLAFSGKKLCLFVGRQPHEEIPPNTEEEVWVTLDREDVEVLSKDRLHLQVDVNNPEESERIQGLFDKVVLDQSCLKFFEDPWRKLGRYLKPLPTSELITEDTTKIITFFNPDERDRDPFQWVHNGSIVIHMSDYIREARETRRTLDECKRDVDARYYEESTARMQNYQRGIFQDVELLRDQPYPFWNRWTEDRPVNYFVLRNPNPVTLGMNKADHDAVIAASS